MSRASRRQVLPATPVATRIDSFTHDGRGVAHVQGKAVFISGALPGETVEFVYTAIRRDFAEGRLTRIIQPSPRRVEPLCPHFGVCGGCRLQHLVGTAQIEEKQRLLLEQLRRLGKVQPQWLLPPLTGPIWGYRHKARLGVKWVAKKGRVLVGFREKGSALLADVQRCAVLHPAVGERLEDLAALIAELSLREALPQIEVAVGDEGAALVFRILRQPSETDLDALRAFGQRFALQIYLQPAGPESVFPLYPKTPTPLTYALPRHDVVLHFQPTDFTQVNVDINRQMIDRVVETLAPQATDTVLDLFCGIGNFTLPLARQAAYVVGVEGNDAAVARARANAARHALSNIEFHVADLFQPQDHAPWNQRRYDLVMLDPARTGACEVLTYVPRWQARRIVYVSCNPSTLARDAGILVHQHGYRLVCAGVMDMFPHTAHVESLALFER